jgi:hypothetical protein
MNDERTVLTPGVEERLRTARELARAKLTEWGAMRVMHGAAFALVVLAAVLPIATIARFGFLGSTTARIHFYDLGLGGWLTILLGAALGAAPFALTLTRRAVAIGFGLACGGVSMLLVPWLLSTFAGAIAYLDFGYYCLAVAFATLVVAYWRRMEDATTAAFDPPIASVKTAKEGTA